MEENQLDFNQPLLSVRKFSTTVSSESENKVETKNSQSKLPPIPVYKSDLKSGPIRNPGTVPFVWEKTPGKPKDERKPHDKVLDRQSGAPKPPPGRTVKIKLENSKRTRKSASATESPKESILSNSKVAKPVNVYPSKDEDLKLVNEERLTSVSDDENETYVDAADTLSRMESFSMSCSVSGVSEWEELDTKPSGTFSTDAQARDFMMDRFLPAAKAVAAETPQHASRKPPVVKEQPRQLRQLVMKEKPQMPDRKRPITLPHYLQDTGIEDNDDDDEDGYDETGNYPSRICGLFPTFCLLNPIPGMRLQDRMPLSSFQGVQAKIKVAKYRESRNPVARNVSCEEKSVTGSPRNADNENENKVGNEFKQPNCKLGHEKCEHSCFEHKNQHGSSDKCDHSYVENTNQHGKGCLFRELLAKEDTAVESDSDSPAVVEKTLYVDAVHRFKSSSCADTTEMEDQVLEKGSGFEHPIKGDKIEEDRASLDSSLKENKKIASQIDEKATLHLSSSQSLDSCFIDCVADRANFNATDGLRCDRNILQDSKNLRSSERVENGRCEASIHDSTSFLNSKVADRQVIDSKRQRAQKSDSSAHCNALALSKGTCDGQIQLESKLNHGEKSNAKHLHPLDLPLPKAPSESWLRRTLPAVPSRNISSRSTLAVQVSSSRIETKGERSPKWETMAKSSNRHYNHLGFSEEKLAPIPET